MRDIDNQYRSPSQQRWDRINRDIYRLCQRVRSEKYPLTALLDDPNPTKGAEMRAIKRLAKGGIWQTHQLLKLDPDLIHPLTGLKPHNPSFKAILELIAKAQKAEEKTIGM